MDNGGKKVMHYYQFNIGDYAKSTRHLTNAEDLAYRRLIDLYYDKEKPLPLDTGKLSRLINMRENLSEIENVLDDFFEKTTDGYVQERIELEISDYRAKQETARVNGKKGGRPKGTSKNQEKPTLVNLANQEKSGLKANQEPITNNQEPLTNNQEPRTSKIIKSTGVDFSVFGMSDYQISELKRIRKANKGGTISQRVADSLAKEFHQAAYETGLSFDELLTEWEVRGWKSFKAEWVKPDSKAKDNRDPFEISASHDWHLGEY